MSGYTNNKVPVTKQANIKKWMNAPIGVFPVK
jgi:hypothetical protein